MIKPLAHYKEKALEMPYRIATALGESPSSKVLLALFVCAFVVLMLHANAFATSSTSAYAELDKAAGGALDAFTCALRGKFGWLLIGCGCLLAIWDYFIQKQGHFLVGAVVGVLAIVILRNVLPEPSMGCNSQP